MFERKVFDPAGFAPAYRTPPHNEEAEQTVLGAILVNNKAFEKVGEFLRPEHFFDPANQKIFQAICRMIDRGQVANPITLKAYFEQDRDLSEIGGPAYIARLAAAIVTVHNLEDYGRVIHDAFLRRQLIEVGEEMVNQAYSHDLEVNARTQVEAVERRLFDLAETGTATAIQEIGQAGSDWLQQVDDARKNRGRPVGASSGLTSVDRVIGGLRPGRLYFLGARPGQGKTALATNGAALATARMGRHVLVMSLEMSAAEINGRALAAVAGIPFERQQAGAVSDRETLSLVEANGHLAALPITIVECPGATIAQVRAHARRAKRTRGGLGLLIVDHLHLMRSSSDARRNGETAAVSEITREFKALAQELRCPVLVLAQLNRDLERRDDKRPTLADLRQSGSIEQDADVVMFLYRAHEYLKKEAPQRRDRESDKDFLDREEAWQAELERTEPLADVIIDKNRFGRRTTVTVGWDGTRTLFSDLDRGQP